MIVSGSSQRASTNMNQKVGLADSPGFRVTAARMALGDVVPRRVSPDSDARCPSPPIARVQAPSNGDILRASRFTSAPASAHNPSRPLACSPLKASNSATSYRTGFPGLGRQGGQRHTDTHQYSVSLPALPLVWDRPHLPAMIALKISRSRFHNSSLANGSGGRPSH